MAGQLGIEYLLLNIPVQRFLLPMSNIRDDDFPGWRCREGMPEMFRTKDFKDLSGRQLEPGKLFFLIIVSDFQIQDLFQKEHCIREASRADTRSRLGSDFQGDLLYSNLARLNNRKPLYGSRGLLQLPLLK